MLTENVLENATRECTLREVPAMKYKLPVVITPLEDGQFMAHCEAVHAVATGDTPDEAVAGLREAIREMVEEFGAEKVFQDLNPLAQVQILEVAAL